MRQDDFVSVIDLAIQAKDFARSLALRKVFKMSLPLCAGSESSGKSTLLERLSMMPLFPRDENVCTKIQIHVQLRRCALQEGLAKMKVVQILDDGTIGNTVKESQPISMRDGDTTVREEMQKLVTEEHGELEERGKKICTTRAIVLEIESPNVPSIDFVDMPGLTGDAEHFDDTSK